MIIFALLLQIAWAQVSCPERIVAVQKTERFVDESKVHSGNLRWAPTILFYEPWEFDLVSMFQDPSILGVSGATGETRLLVQLYNKKRGAPVQEIELAPNVQEPQVFELDGKTLRFLMYRPEGSLFTLFSTAASKRGAWLKFSLVERGQEICSHTVPFDNHAE
ncbi:MAG: hypothetical protein AB7F86_13580 [Bdellovibrionales bacterium]